MRILLIRTDKIGDAVTVLPAIALLRRQIPDAYIAVFCSEYVKDIYKNNPDINEIIIKTSLKADIQTIKSKHFDISVIFYLDKYAAKLAYKARIPQHIGPASKIWALLLNRRIKQSRSKELKHEADYNIDLLAPLGVRPEQVAPKIYVTKENALKAKRYLKEKFNIDTQKDKFIIVHPGTGGSSLKWPADNFAELIKKTAEAFPQYKILLTGGTAEKELLSFVSKQAEPAKTFIANEFPLLFDLISVINECSLFVANATGPLHIASALGKKTVSFYPNVKGATVKRWAPYGKGHITLVAGSGKPIKKKQCPPDFMSQITVDDAFEAVKKQL